MDDKKKKINKNNYTLILILITVIAVPILVYSIKPFYILNETELAVITRLGKVVNSEHDAGLKFKIPLLDVVHIYPRLILEWDGEIQEFPTNDKVMIRIDTTVRWRINNAELFYIRNKNIGEAISKLDGILDDVSRTIVSKHSFYEIVRNSDRINTLDEKSLALLQEESGVAVDDIKKYPTISIGRSDLEGEMKSEVVEKVADLGIEINEFYIKKANYIKDNLESVYGRMIQEREKYTQKFISEGEQWRKIMQGKIQEDSEITLAAAREEARIILGEADAEAARYYREVYNQNASTRDFFEFIKKMEVYKKTSKNTSLIISTDSDFYDFFKEYR